LRARRLDTEVDALIEVMSAKNPVTVRRSKFVLNKGADLPLSGAMAFEVPIQPFANKPGRFATAGMEDFAEKETRRSAPKDLEKASGRTDLDTQPLGASHRAPDQLRC